MRAVQEPGISITRRLVIMRKPVTTKIKPETISMAREYLDSFFASVVNHSRTAAAKRKGIPKPSEYKNKRSTPLPTVFSVEAIIRTEERIGPTQGVHPIAKTEPTRKALTGLPPLGKANRFS